MLLCAAHGFSGFRAVSFLILAVLLVHSQSLYYTTSFVQITFNVRPLAVLLCASQPPLDLWLLACVTSCRPACGMIHSCDRFVTTPRCSAASFLIVLVILTRTQNALKIITAGSFAKLWQIGFGNFLWIGNNPQLGEWRAPSRLLLWSLVWAALPQSSPAGSLSPLFFHLPCAWRR